MHKEACPVSKRGGKPAARAFAAFIRDSRGVTAVEFGMVIFPFMLMIAGIFEVGLAYFRTVQLQNVAESAARQLRLHATSMTTAKQFQDKYVCTSTRQAGTLGSMFDCSKVVVVITTASSWSGASWGTPSDMAGSTTSTSATTMPLPEQVGTLLVIYKAPMLFKNFQQVLGKMPRDGTTYYPSGKAAFRVEPSS
jgi:Flp pilus assembly protein TadG